MILPHPTMLKAAHELMPVPPIPKNPLCRVPNRRLSNGTHSPTLDSGSNTLLKTFPKLALSSPSMCRMSSRSRDGRSPLQLLRDESVDSVDRQDSLTL